MEGCGPCDLSLNAAITTETCSSYVNFTVFSIPPLEADISLSSAKVAIVFRFGSSVTNVYFPGRSPDSSSAGMLPVRACG